MWKDSIRYARTPSVSPAAPPQKPTNSFTGKPHKRPDWLLVMVVVLALFTLLVAWLVALPYW